MGFGSGNSLGMGIIITIRENVAAIAPKIARAFKNMQRTVSSASAKMNQAFTSMITGLAGLSITVGALVGPFGLALKSSAALSAELSEVAAKARIEKTSDEFKKLEKQTLDLGEATKFTSIEVAKGQRFLAQTGLDTVDILEAMPGLLSLAAAGNLDLARSADIASNILVAMGLEASEMNRVADVLAAASTRANVSVDQLGEAFKFAAPFAQQMNVSLETTSALIGMLGDMGVQGTLAGTAFKNFVAQTAQLDAKKLAEFGLGLSDIQDAAGNMLELPVVFSNIIQRIQGLGSRERVRALTELFGLRGNVAIATQLSKTAKDLKTFSVTLENSAGEANRIAEKMLDNFNGDVIKFRSVLTSTFIIAGRSFEEGLRPIIQAFTVWLKAIKSFIATPFGKWIVRVSAALASLTSVVLTLGFVASVVAPAIFTLMTAFIEILPFILPIIAAFAVLAGSVFIVTRGIQEFNKVLSGAEKRSGFLGFLQKVGGMAKAIVQIFRSWNGETFSLTENMVKALERIGILDIVLKVSTWIVRFKEFFNGVVSGAKMIWGVTSEIFRAMRQSVMQLVDTFIEFFPSLRKGAGDLNNWERAGKVFGFVVTEFIIRPINILMLAILAVTQILNSFLELVQDVPKLLGKFIPFGEQLGRIVQAVAPKAIEFLKGEGEDVGAGRLVPAVAGTAAPGLANIGETIAEIRRLSTERQSPAVIDNTVTQTEEITIINQLDGQEISRQTIDRELLENSRQ